MKRLKMIATGLLLAVLLSLLTACQLRTKFEVNFIVDGEVYAIISTGGSEVIKMPNNPQKENYSFDGWYWDNGTWTQPFTASSLLEVPLAEDMSVYAKFSNGESVTGTSAVFTGYEKIEDPSLGTVYMTSVANEKEVYSFSDVIEVENTSHWALSTDLSGKDVIVSKTVQLSVGNNVFYVLVENQYGQSRQYTVIVRRRPVYTIDYYLNDGSYYSTEKVEENSYANPPFLTRAGFCHTGWSEDLSAPITENKVVTAIWAANEYVITYDTNGGEMAVDEQKVTYGEYYSQPTPVKQGYVFTGWYKDGQKLSAPYIYEENITVVASWKMQTYTISYHLNGGVNHFENPTSYTVQDEIVLKVPSKNGHTFIGWTTDEVTTPTKEFTIFSGSVGDKVFSANWKVNSYVVTFDANGGSCATTSKKITYGEVVSLPIPEKEGYSFVGWYCDNVRYQSGTWQNTTNLSLTAKWQLNQYSIDYVLDGGTNGANPDEYAINETIILRDPSKKGYTFLGWTTSGVSIPTKELSISSGNSGNRTFIAHWKANSYNVAFDVNGGDCSLDNKSVFFDEEIVLPIPSKLGYDFLGWYCGNIQYQNGAWTTANDVTLTAKWKATPYRIAYQLNGGDEKTNPYEYTVHDTFVLTDPQRTGYIFLGWTSDGIEAPTKNLTISAGSTGDKVFVAHWKAATYLVTFDANGGECAKETDNVVFDAYFALPTPQKTGYTFLGWYCGNTKYQSGAWTTANNMTLVAKWSLNTYSITYQMNSGMNSGENAKTYTVHDTLVLTDPQRTGYIFLGWTSDGIEAPTKNLTISAGSTGDKVFVAHWKAATYLVTFDANGGECVTENLNITFNDSFVLPSAQKTGYTFLGWYYGETKCQNGVWNTTFDITLTAKWSIDTYSITYQMNSGMNSGDNAKTYTVHDTLVLTDPQRTGYIFLGWTGDGIEAPTKNLTISAGSTGDKVFVAHWKANSYTVSLNLNGGSGDFESIVVTYDESFSLPIPQKEGDVFWGWYNNGVKYTDGIWQKDSDFILYAVWLSSLYTRVDSEGNANSEGEYIQFGTWPQREVESTALKEILTSLVGALPVYGGASESWVPYSTRGAQLTDSASSYLESYMWYQDVEYGGEWYRAVYFTHYAPYKSYYSSSKENSYQDDNGYYIDTLYFFKHEPILWRILEEKNGKAFLLCEMILDMNLYAKRESFNYKRSIIREWLNQIFYETAFNDLERELIQLTMVDNSLASTGMTSNRYICPNTEDYVFLLSYQEVWNEEYGLGSSVARKKYATDYAQCQGLDCSSAEIGTWWLRSPYDTTTNDYRAQTVSERGSTSNMSILGYYHIGVCPALWINLGQ